MNTIILLSYNSFSSLFCPLTDSDLQENKTLVLLQTTSTSTLPWQHKTPASESRFRYQQWCWIKEEGHTLFKQTIHQYTERDPQIPDQFLQGENKTHCDCLSQSVVLLERLCCRLWQCAGASEYSVFSGGFSCFSFSCFSLTPSLPQPVKFPSWMMHGHACKQYIFRSYNVYFRCCAF